MNRIRVSIADDHQLILDGIRALLQEVEDIELVYEANNGRELLKSLELVRPDVVLMDLDMPEMDGKTTTVHIKSHFPDIQVIALTMHDDLAIVRAMMRAGARGYLLKNTSTEELCLAIRRVAAGDSFFSGSITAEMLRMPTPGSEKPVSTALLTKREKEILILIASGNSNTEIGEQLHISPRTVDTHRTNLMKKLGVRNIAGLIRYAFQQGWVS